MRIYISRAPSDPICARVSVGGNEKLGVYCVFRGSSQECIVALEEALKAMKTASDNLESLPVDRKYKDLGSD
jgi:hypothetical protein